MSSFDLVERRGIPLLRPLWGLRWNICAAYSTGRLIRSLLDSPPDCLVKRSRPHGFDPPPIRQDNNRDGQKTVSIIMVERRGIELYQAFSKSENH